MKYDEHNINIIDKDNDNKIGVKENIINENNLDSVGKK